MPRQKRHRIEGYKGIYFIIGTHPTGKEERVYYAQYKRSGKPIEERIGGQFRDAMTPHKAARIRAARIDGKQECNSARRERERREREAETDSWTIARLWHNYKEAHPDVKGLSFDESRYKCYLAPPFGDREPKDIRPLDVDRIRVDLLKKGKASQTVRNTLELLRRLVNHGSARGLCEGLSFKVKLPKASDPKTECLSSDEIRRLLDVLNEWPDVHMANALELALYSGMRRGEILRLEWRDLDFRNGVIHIRNPKGGKDQTIPMNKKARVTLKRHPRVRGNRIFQPQRDVSTQARAIRKAAELPGDFRVFHGLRHTFGSLLVSSGVSLYQVQKLLGHAHPAQTTRYAHLSDQALKAASDQIGDLLEGGKVIDMHTRSG